MPNKNNEKKQYFLDSFQKIVCHDTDLQPFINGFHFKGANFDQQKIGEIFGVIQVFDYSENSAYIPNLIAQVIKKEFFSQHRRKTSDSFEAALHKANLALTDLAQHEIIEWIGKINAVIGVIRGNEFHFTQAGGGKILLLRDKVLMNISKGLDTGEGIGHPIKTFSNTSSGKLDFDDKIIFASETVFESLRMDELKRHVQTFNSEELDNIISSTLEIEAENAASIIINVKEKIALEMEATEKKKIGKAKKEMNYFGNNLKEDDKPSIETITKEPEKKEMSSPEEIKKEIEETAQEISQKTKQSDPEKQEPLSKAQALAAAEEKIKKMTAQREKDLKAEENQIDEKATAEYYNSSNEDSPFKNEPELFIKEKDLQEDEIFQEKKKLKTSPGDMLKIKLNILSNYFEKFSEKINFSGIKNILPSSRITQKNHRVKREISQDSSFDFETKPKFKEISAPIQHKNLPNPSLLEKIIYYSKIFSISVLKKIKRFAIFTKRKIRKIVKKLKRADWKNIFTLENIKKNYRDLIQKIKSIKENFKFDGDWKVLAGLMGIAILIILLIFLSIKFMKPLFRDNISKNEPTENQPSLLENPILEKEFETGEIKTLNQIKEKISSVTSLDENLYFSTEKNQLLELNTQNNQLKEIALPDYIDNIQTITAMPSLRLVFIVNSNSVYSYSPVTNRFYENKIDLPSGFESQSSSVYLTYIYLLDKNSNQIYQYPRAAGGFGEKKEWLRENHDLSESSSLAIDGSIFITYSNGQINKFFQGRKQNDFQITQTEPAIFASKMRGNINSENLFILDSNNQRIIEINKQGAIKKQFQDRQFLGAQNFWVDFDQKIIYIVSSEGKVLSFNYN